MLLFFFFLLLFSSASGKLSVDYYNASCPDLHRIVSDILTPKQISSPTTAAGVLRLFFHDCFVSGCDASILLSSSPFSVSERDADINHSLPGDAFDAIVRLKSSLELLCPSTVSCADLLSISARHLLSMLGGPFFPLLLGRKDSLSPTPPSLAESILPRSNSSIDHLILLFSSRGFSARDLVALSGAHTVGFSHCSEYADRIFQSGGGNGDSPAFDPTMNPRFARALQKACARYREDPTIATFNDVMTPGKFDNMYYRNLLMGLGLLGTDQKMVADPRTAPFVKLYAANQTAFFQDFVRAIRKLSVYGVKMGRKGEVRRRCDALNNFPA